MEETLFSLAFGMEAVIPLEIGLPSLKDVEYNKDTNSKWLQVNLYLLKKSREWVSMRMASYSQRVAKYYNSQVKTKEFRVGDLILQQAKVFQPTEQGNLSPY